MSINIVKGRRKGVQNCSKKYQTYVLKIRWSGEPIFQFGFDWSYCTRSANLLQIGRTPVVLLNQDLFRSSFYPGSMWALYRWEWRTSLACKLRIERLISHRKWHRIITVELKQNVLINEELLKNVKNVCKHRGWLIEKLKKFILSVISRSNEVKQFSQIIQYRARRTLVI